MKINQGDYLILRMGVRAELARCTKAEDKKYTAVLEKESKDVEGSAKIDVVEFEYRDVLTNLGRHPEVGTVYGQKIEPLKKQFTAGNAWTNIKLYQDLTETEEEALKHELVVASKRLRALGVHGLKHVVEVRNPQGKYAGYHKYRPKGEVDILCVKPEKNLEGLQYLIFHEYAHGMWHRSINARTRLRWIQLYHEYITLQAVLGTELEEVLSEVTSAGSIKDFLSDCDDQSLLIVKDALRHISHVHSLNKKHLELALVQGESIEAYWPTSLELSEKETCITEYARVSPEEFFAEAFAFHFCGRKVPKKIEAVINTTLGRLIKGGSSVPARKAKPSPEEDTSKVVKKKKKTIRSALN